MLSSKNFKMEKETKKTMKKIGTLKEKQNEGLFNSVIKYLCKLLGTHVSTLVN
jgi:hypothetical protein